MSYNEVLIKPLHQQAGGLIGNTPEADDNGRHSGIDKRTGKTDHAFAPDHLPNSGLTGGKDHQVGIQFQSGDLISPENAVFLTAAVL
jgi:hypothetical protein